MFKFRNTILLGAICLFSSAVFGADKVAEQIVNDFENDKQSTIAKLKTRQDALEKAGKSEDAKSVKEMIGKIENSAFDGETEEVDGNTNAEVGKNGIPKGAQKVTVLATSHEGVSLGKFKKNEKMEIAYVSGEWAHGGGGGPKSSPDVDDNEYRRCAITDFDKKKDRNEPIYFLPPNTSKKPLIYKFDKNYDNVSLRILEALNAKGSLMDNSGEITYWFRRVK